MRARFTEAASLAPPLSHRRASFSLRIRAASFSAAVARCSHSTTLASKVVISSTNDCARAVSGTGSCPPTLDARQTSIATLVAKRDVCSGWTIAAMDSNGLERSNRPAVAGTAAAWLRRAESTGCALQTERSPSAPPGRGYKYPRRPDDVTSSTSCDSASTGAALSSASPARLKHFLSYKVMILSYKVMSLSL